mmetsp:Transcript_34300/g.96446  ORF Transcript_34300/g.96446 Transcript_34300/m.96446 type:complete len:291 (+) Transcript_34300:29-901(+)
MEEEGEQAAPFRAQEKSKPSGGASSAVAADSPPAVAVGRVPNIAISSCRLACSSPSFAISAISRMAASMNGLRRTSSIRPRSCHAAVSDDTSMKASSSMEHSLAAPRSVTHSSCRVGGGSSTSRPSLVILRLPRSPSSMSTRQHPSAYQSLASRRVFLTSVLSSSSSSSASLHTSSGMKDSVPDTGDAFGKSVAIGSMGPASSWYGGLPSSEWRQVPGVIGVQGLTGSGSMRRARPKSVSLAWSPFSCEETRMFSGFRSRKTILLPWRLSRARATHAVYLAVFASGSPWA